MTLVAIFSHELTQEQIEDAKKNLNVKEFIYLPYEIGEIWSQIPTDLMNLNEYLQPIYTFLNSIEYNKPYVLVQGDFGATYAVVNYAKSLSMTPIYSTTKRVSYEERIHGSMVKTSHFKHILFRRYA